MPTPDPETWCPPPPTPPPSQDRRQLMPGCDFDSLKHVGWSMLLITGLIRNMLAAHFSSPSFLENTALKSLIWQPGEQTGIMIESVTRYRAALADKRPAILVKRNACQNMRIVRNDSYGPDGQGEEHFTTLWVGSHTVFCIHGSGASCEILATESQRDLTEFGPVIVDRMGLKKFQVVEVGTIAEVEEATQNFVVPVTVGWAFEESWKLSSEQPVLAAIAFRNLNLGEL